MVRAILSKCRSRVRSLWEAEALFHYPLLTRRIRLCPICGSDQLVFEAKNRVSDLDRCTVCTHVFTRKQPKDRLLRRVYGDFGYWIKDKAHQGIHNVEYGPQWEGFINARIGIMTRCGMLDGEAKKRFFEIGCSEGILLKALADRGHEASGCEMNPEIGEAGRRSLGVDIASAMFEQIELPENSFDGVVSFHTIEHVCSPHDILKKVARILKANGAVLIEVPIGPEEYANIDHLHFFSRESVDRLLKTHFEYTEVIDNCYVNPFGVLIGSVYGLGRRPRSGKRET